MGNGLRQRIKQERFESVRQEAVFNLMVAADYLRTEYDRVFTAYNLTSGQYNVLRILRGVYPEGHPRCEIAMRMLERAPDVTRLVDRLEASGLVERDRSEEDRRLSITRITAKGLELVDEMQPALDEVQKRLHRRLTNDEAVQISRVCEALYAPEDN